MTEHFIHFFKRHLQQLKDEMEAYPSEESIWLLPDGISNTAGNLCYHLVGNLNHFIGQGLGNSGYIRNRDLEFTIKGVSRTELVKNVEDTSAMIERVLSNVTDLSQPHPKGYFPWEKDIHYYLLQLLWHLTYHLGQINYHRRLLTKI